jgi:hypothetical protein
MGLRRGNNAGRMSSSTRSNSTLGGDSVARPDETSGLTLALVRSHTQEHNRTD